MEPATIAAVSNGPTRKGPDGVPTPSSPAAHHVGEGTAPCERTAASAALEEGEGGALSQSPSVADVTVRTVAAATGGYSESDNSHNNQKSSEGALSSSSPRATAAHLLGQSTADDEDKESTTPNPIQLFVDSRNAGSRPIHNDRHLTRGQRNGTPNVVDCDESHTSTDSFCHRLVAAIPRPNALSLSLFCVTVAIIITAACIMSVQSVYFLDSAAATAHRTSSMVASACASEVTNSLSRAAAAADTIQYRVRMSYGTPLPRDMVPSWNVNYCLGDPAFGGRVPLYNCDRKPLTWYHDWLPTALSYTKDNVSVINMVGFGFTDLSYITCVRSTNIASISCVQVDPLSKQNITAIDTRAVVPQPNQIVSSWDVSGNPAKKIAFTPSFFDVRQRPWYQAISKVPKFAQPLSKVWGDFTAPTYVGQSAVSISFSLVNRSGEFLGVGRIALEFGALQDIFEVLNPTENTAAFLLDSSNRVLATSHNSMGYTTTLPTDEEASTLSTMDPLCQILTLDEVQTTQIVKVIRKICRTTIADVGSATLSALAEGPYQYLLNSTATITSTTSATASRVVTQNLVLGGERVWTTVQPIRPQLAGDIGWRLVVFVPERDLTKDALRSLYIAVGISVGIAVLVVLAVLVTVGRTLLPLTAIAQEMQAATYLQEESGGGSEEDNHSDTPHLKSSTGSSNGDLTTRRRVNNTTNRRVPSYLSDVAAIQQAYWTMVDEIRALRGYIPQHVCEEVLAHARRVNHNNHSNSSMTSSSSSGRRGGTNNGVSAVSGSHNHTNSSNRRHNNGLGTSHTSITISPTVSASGRNRNHRRYGGRYRVVGREADEEELDGPCENQPPQQLPTYSPRFGRPSSSSGDSSNDSAASCVEMDALDHRDVENGAATTTMCEAVGMSRQQPPAVRQRDGRNEDDVLSGADEDDPAAEMVSIAVFDDINAMGGDDHHHNNAGDHQHRCGDRRGGEGEGGFGTSSSKDFGSGAGPLPLHSDSASYSANSSPSRSLLSSSRHHKEGGQGREDAAGGGGGHYVSVAPTLQPAVAASSQQQRHLAPSAESPLGQVEEMGADNYSILCAVSVVEGPPPPPAAVSEKKVAHYTNQLASGSNNIIYFRDSCLVDRNITIVVVNIVEFHQYALVTHGADVAKHHEALVAFMSSTATRCGGVLDTFSGDKFWVSFNATAKCDHSQVAAGVFALEVSTAVNKEAADARTALLEERRRRLNNEVVAERYRARFPAALMGVTAGIATGRAFVGPLGTSTIRRHSIISNAMSEAAALERLAPHYPGCSVMIGGDMIPAIEGYFQYQLLDAMPLPGSQGKRRRVASLGGAMCAAGKNPCLLKALQRAAPPAHVGASNTPQPPPATNAAWESNTAPAPSLPHQQQQKSTSSNFPTTNPFNDVNALFNAFLEGRAEESRQLLGTLSAAASADNCPLAPEHRTAIIIMLKYALLLLYTNPVDGRVYSSGFGRLYEKRSQRKM